jgi:hypothetical protein
MTNSIPQNKAHLLSELLPLAKAAYRRADLSFRFITVLL